MSAENSETFKPNNEMPKATALNDSTSPSCMKCVKVLRDLVSSLQDSSQDTGKSMSTASSIFGSLQRSISKSEPAPLTLLKAIGEATESDSSKLRVEMIDDGVKLYLPVETTLPNALRGFAEFMESKQSPPSRVMQSSPGSASSSGESPTGQRLPLALSVNKVEDKGPSFDGSTQLKDPLTVELKCRKCASTGPEAGARAFLMGPQPLSVVVCHNRVQSEQKEIEEILTHELVHLYDVQTQRLDLQDCENLAYSEVRAARAAECRDSWHPHLQSYCVKQKAICATNNLFPIEGRKCIQKVFEHAFGDNRPFPNPKNPS